MVKQPGRDADHSSPSIARVKNRRSFISTSPYVSMASCPIKHRESFSFTLVNTMGLNASCLFVQGDIHSSDILVLTLLNGAISTLEFM